MAIRTSLSYLPLDLFFILINRWISHIINLWLEFFCVNSLVIIAGDYFDHFKIRPKASSLFCGKKIHQ